MREVVARRCSTKKASLKITQNSQKKCARVSGCQKTVRLATLLKRNPRTSVSEPAVRKYSLKQMILNNHKVNRKARSQMFFKIVVLRKIVVQNSCSK